MVRQFGGILAVDVERVQVQRGSITALIGPNGAGKTTFFNLLTGFDEPTPGWWQFDGHEMSGVAPHKTAKMGMVRTFQLTKSLTKLPVIENMKLGATDQRGEKWWNALVPSLWKAQEREIEATGRRTARPLHARPHARRVRRGAVRRATQAARDGTRADDEPDGW